MTSSSFRKGIDYIGVTIAFIVHDGQGRILLQKRSSNTRDENGRWDIGGGAVEFGEASIDTVSREIQEELCVKPQNIRFLTTYDAFRKQNDLDTHWVALVYTAEVIPGEVKIGEPHKIDELGWFTSDNLPSPLHSQFWKAYQPALDTKIVK